MRIVPTPWRQCLLYIALIMPLAVGVTDIPQQIHIHQGNADGNAIIISWITSAVNGSQVLLAAEGRKYVEYFGMVAPRRYTYPPSAARYTSGLIHHVVIEGLSFSGKYTYRCGSDDGGWSAELTFTTPPRPSSKVKVTFAIVGDIGWIGNSMQTMKDLLADPTITMWMIPGDLAYADGNQQYWDYFWQAWQPIFSTVPTMILPGNHEMEDYQDYFRCYKARILQPDFGRLYYSYNYGSVHFVLLNDHAESLATNSPQWTWLANDLAAVDRKATPWVILGCHTPWYSSSVYHANEQTEVDHKRYMEDMINTYAVDLVYTGHVHNYERTHPTYQGRVVVGAPIYLIVGAGGFDVHPGYFTKPAWSAFRNDGKTDAKCITGTGRLEVPNATHLRFTWKSLTTCTTGSVLDDVWFVKNAVLNNGVTRGASAFGA